MMILLLKVTEINGVGEIILKKAHIQYSSTVGNVYSHQYSSTIMHTLMHYIFNQCIT